ncbi:omptin family outer membrane protease [Sinorhizobium terangae]|uniref:omptin family outer membrane protease n=1 Tax=Sinorhizobium terangae TaxID=110322 RepID=UPI0024B04E46|nr:omptin family outer membrane protease [Sinorhizobium terangae]WFU51787.1 omptin family outer membrane protease [Sinorhizobium terangae]
MTLHIRIHRQEDHGRKALNSASSLPCDAMQHPYDELFHLAGSPQRNAAATSRSQSKSSAEAAAGMAGVMRRFTALCPVFVFGAFCATSTAAMAADETIYAAPDSSFVLVGGVGYTQLRANELVYDSAGNRVSKLIWESDAPVLTTGFKAAFGNSWTIAANSVIGFSGESHMEDYDWYGFSPGFGQGDWASRSISPDTALDRYVNLDIAAGRDFGINDATTINLHGGFKYTDVKWTAYGGTIIYSGRAFRDTQKTFEPGKGVISYEQRYPGVFLGAETITRLGDWTLSGLLRGGLVIDASDIDDHWLRTMHSKGEFGTEPFVSFGAKADYQVTDRVNLFLAGNFDKYFRKKGDWTIDKSKDTATGIYKNRTGMDLQAFTISAGFKLTF